MNKLFTKIAAFALGSSMAIGVGVAVASNSKEATAVNAAETAGSTQTLTITRSFFSSTTASYAWYDWTGSTTGGTSISGKAEIYASTADSMQFNKGKGNKVGAIFNTTAIPGSITKIEGTTASGNNRTWNAYVASTAYSASGSTLTAGSNATKLNSSAVSVTTSSTTIGESTHGYSYFCIQENVSSASYISQFKITYTVPQKYTVSFGVNTAGYGTVSSSSITNVPSGTSITTNGNQITINGSTVTATPTASTSQYTYAFTGWSNNTGTVTAARTITANFSRTTNTFTVNGDGILNGSLDDTSNIEYGGYLDVNVVPDTNYTYPNSVTVKMGGVDISDDILYEDGYIYYGPVTGNIVISGSCVLDGTAYTVTYNPNSGSVSPTSEEIIENGHPTFPTPTRSGYNFKGWQVNGSGTAYTDPNDYTVTADVTFVASWAAVYTVTFNSNGGSTIPASKSVETGSTFTFPSAGTKDHYTFDGWTNTGSAPYYAEGATSPAVTGAITYTAHWTADAQYTVTYSAGSNGSGSYAHTSQWSGSYTLLAIANLTGVTANEGYQFKNYTVGGVNKNPGETITLSAATTVTVNFEEKPVTDVITLATTGVTATAYASGSFSGKSSTNSGHSAAVYAGQVIKSGNGYLQMRATSPGGIVSTTSGGKVRGVTITWDTAAMSSSAKSLDIYGSTSAYSTAADLYSTDTDGDSLGSISYTNTTSYETHLDITGDYTYIGLCSNSGTMYIQEIDIDWELPPVLSSVTTSGQTASFTAGNKWSYGGTLTAHYTAGKADATVTPTSFKYGASNIDPTSAGTTITTNTTLDSTFNGKYVYVVYTEDAVTKWASYQITINAAPATSVTLSSYTDTVGLNTNYDVTDITATVNPSAYATQGVTWEVYDSDGLVEGETYSFDGETFSASQPADVVFHVKANSNNSIYAEFTLTVSGDPMVVLYNSSNVDVTSGSASVFGDAGTITYHVTDENFEGTVTYTWSSSNDSIISVDDDQGASCGFYVEGPEGSARLSCRVQGSSKGDVTVYIDVTVTAVTVTSVSWTAPTINVYSGATLSSTSGWNVKYRTNSDPSTDKTPDSFKIMLDGSEISLPYTWSAADDGKTLGVQVGGVNSSTTTVSVTQSLQAVMADVMSESEYTFTTNAWADSSNSWSGSGNGNGFTSGQGVQMTTSQDGITVTSKSSFSNISQIIITYNTNKSSGAGSFDVKVGTNTSQNVSATWQSGDDGRSMDYTATFNYATKQSGVVAFTVNVDTNSLWVKSIKIVTSTGLTNIANVAGHEAAQKAVVKFAKAMNEAFDDTSLCTEGVAAAWSTASSEYATFLSDISSLSEAEQEYAKNLIKYATAQYTDDTDEDFSYCLERAMATYETCIQKHGQTGFMTGVRSPANTSMFPFAFEAGEASSIIVVLAMMSLTVYGGYFFLRKKKEQ